MDNSSHYTKYRIKGLHCTSCTEDFLKEYRGQLEQNDIKYDEEHNYLLIGDEADWNVLYKITSFEKVNFEKIIEDDEELNVNHGHDHGHHHHLEGQSATKMWLVFAINVFFSLFEFIFGTIFNSSAILADAVHDLGDALSIGVSAMLEGISKREPTKTFSFGYERFSLLGSVLTALVLVVGAVITIVNAVPKLFNPEAVNETGIFWIALVAIAANALGAWILRDGKSANESMLNLHLLEDILGWAAVLVMSIVLQFTDWYILDPILSIVIAVFILTQALPSFKKSGVVFLEGVPEDIDVKAIEEEILKIDGVVGISHFHVWSLDGQNHSMSLTVSIDSKVATDEELLKQRIREVVFPQNITHVTIEIVEDIK